MRRVCCIATCMRTCRNCCISTCQSRGIRRSARGVIDRQRLALYSEHARLTYGKTETVVRVERRSALQVPVQHSKWWCSPWKHAGCLQTSFARLRLSSWLCSAGGTWAPTSIRRPKRTRSGWPLGFVLLIFFHHVHNNELRANACSTHLVWCNMPVDLRSNTSVMSDISCKEISGFCERVCQTWDLTRWVGWFLLWFSIVGTRSLMPHTLVD